MRRLLGTSHRPPSAGARFERWVQVRGSASGTSYPVPAPRSSLARRWLVEEPRTMQDALLQGSNGGHLQKPELRLYAQRFWLAFVFCACA